MAKTASTMLELGTTAPKFSLPDASGKAHTFENLRGRNGTVVMFICNHCPYVIHIAKVLAGIVDTYAERGVGFVAINANDIAKYPDDAPAKMLEFSKRYALTSPYLFDESQEVAKAYRAACTPDIYVFDRSDALVYRGQFDESRPGNGAPVTGGDLCAALDQLLQGQKVSDRQKPSIGCNIKWRAGNEPQYFAMG